MDLGIALDMLTTLCMIMDVAYTFPVHYCTKVEVMIAVAYNSIRALLMQCNSNSCSYPKIDEEAAGSQEIKDTET